MDKNSSLFPNLQERKVISFSKLLSGKKMKVDFDAPDLSSNGGLLFANAGNCSFIDKISDCISDVRNPYFIQHAIVEMVRQRVGPIACGYEDANDCDSLRHDSALKMMAGRLPSGNDLCSQPTMTRLENDVGLHALYEIGRLFVKEFVRSFDKAPKRIILGVDDTNAGRPLVVQQIQGQPVQIVSLCSRLHADSQDKTHCICKDCHRRLHHRKLYPTYYAEHRIDQRE